MDAKTLTSLSPIDQTSAGINAALERVASAKQNALGTIAAAKAGQAATALTSTSKERREVADAISDAESDVVQLDGIAVALADALAEAKLREAHELAKVSHAATTARLSAHDAKFFDDFFKIENSLKNLLVERKKVTDLVDGHNVSTVMFRELRIEARNLDRPFLDVRFYLSSDEIAQARQAENARKVDQAFALGDAKRERFRLMQLEYASRPPLPLGPHATVMPG